LANTSSANPLSDELALFLRDQIVAGELPQERLLEELLRRALSADGAEAQEAGDAMFRIIAERLGDLFEPRLCEAYASLFARAVEAVDPRLTAKQLIERYRRVRTPRLCDLAPKIILVLSRVTIGADIAITSVIIHALKQRFAGARILFVGPRKNFELFADDPRVELYEHNYPRSGTLRDRLDAMPKLGGDDDVMMVDPDSRLSQLGLLPIYPEDRYFFFESRGFLAHTTQPLSKLTAQWCGQVFGVPFARPYIAPKELETAEDTDIAISFGVGGNPEKQMEPIFERSLLEALVAKRRRILLDCGASPDEMQRVQWASAGLPGIELHFGAFAPFAARIAKANLYIGYDSAGQHVAAATRTPLISIFKGYISERFLQRWTPSGHDRITVLPVQEPEGVLDKVLAAVQGQA
jgi:ADP-heptose:LPS heptosyltransferase